MRAYLSPWGGDHLARARQLLPRRGGHHHELEAVDVIEQIDEREPAITLLGAQIAAREQAAQKSPGGTVTRIGENVRRAVGKHQARAWMIAQRQILLALDEMRAHDAGDRVAIAEAKSGKACLRRLH